MKKFRTHYENLQVAEHASIEVIKGAYKFLTHKHHPDRNPEDREEAERIMRIINNSYKVLSDPDRRKQHDSWISRKRAEEAAGGSKSSQGSTGAEESPPKSEQTVTKNTASRSIHGHGLSVTLLFLLSSFVVLNHWTKTDEEQQPERALQPKPVMQARTDFPQQREAKPQSMFRPSLSRPEAVGLAGGDLKRNQELKWYLEEITERCERLLDQGQGWVGPCKDLLPSSDMAIEIVRTEGLLSDLYVKICSQLRIRDGLRCSFLYWHESAELRENVAGIYESLRAYAASSTSVASSIKHSAMDTKGLDDAIDQLHDGNHEVAYKLLLPLHEKGVAKASFNLAIMYLNGDYVEKSREKAIALLSTASDNGYSEATFILGILHRKNDPATYAQLERKAAEQGHPIAAQQIGLAYYTGYGVPENKVLAYKWLFGLQVRGSARAETWTTPLENLESSLSIDELKKGRVMAWNFVYLDCTCGFYQKEFEQNNPGLNKRISVNNYRIENGILFIQ